MAGKNCCLHVLTSAERKLWLDSAVSAMQGLQESSSKLISELSDSFAEITAKRAFDIADAMVKEYRKRTFPNERQS